MTTQMESALNFGFELNDRPGARVSMGILTCALPRAAAIAQVVAPHEGEP